jgi:ADP-ribosyl-[dinitrogen reductase] hydrolase
MLEGSCLCGRVAYQADAVVDALIHCHCQTCRKAHGAAMSSIAAVPRERFRWSRGEADLKFFESSPGKRRWFCAECGSHIMAEREDRPTVMLRLGCLDTPIEVDRQWHIWRSDAASWYDPKRLLPEAPEGIVARP